MEQCQSKERSSKDRHGFNNHHHHRLGNAENDDDDDVSRGKKRMRNDDNGDHEDDGGGPSQPSQQQPQQEARQQHGRRSGRSRSRHHSSRERTRSSGRRRNDGSDDCDDDDDDYDESDKDRAKRHPKQRGRKRATTTTTTTSSEDSDADAERKHRSRKSSRKRSRRREDVTSSSSSSETSTDGGSSSNDEEDRDRRRDDRRRKDSSREHSHSHSLTRKREERKGKQEEHRKDRKKKKKKERKKRSRNESKEKRSKDKKKEQNDTAALSRNFQLTDALCHVLESYPALVEDLPVMLLRLASGTSFDLSSIVDARLAQGIVAVFTCLEPFGVVRQEQKPGDGKNHGTWIWKNPAGKVSSSSSLTTTTDLVLIKVVRALLDQIGLTMEAVDTFEQEQQRHQEHDSKKPAAPTHSVPLKAKDKEEDIVQQQTLSILTANFDKDKTTAQNSSLRQELASLCRMILKGESIDMTGLPNVQLREALESLFVACGLERTEMDVGTRQDDDDDDKGPSKGSKSATDDTPSMGYGLPVENRHLVVQKLQVVLNTCATYRPSHAAAAAAGLHRTENSDDDDDDMEGPAPLGATLRKGPALPVEEQVKAQAARRARELDLVKRGLDPSSMDHLDGGQQQREEWMLVPGEKLDFLGQMKAGQAIKSRQFQAKCQAASVLEQQQASEVDPAVRAEMDAIRQLHQESRGPSLLEQHRQAKAEAAAAAANHGSKRASWKWDRDQDLDKGRRVDKDALNTVLAGAATNLKTKFQGGFGAGM